jgi:hypothetical protein
LFVEFLFVELRTSIRPVRWGAFSVLFGCRNPFSFLGILRGDEIRMKIRSSATLLTALLSAVIFAGVGCAGITNASHATISSAPTITTQPSNQTIPSGQSATFLVLASGSAPLNYQWQKNGSPITGATSRSYTTPATISTDNGSAFQVVVSNSAGSVTSTAATLTVSPAVVTPTITTQPVNQTVTAGQTATFSVVANGTAPLSYQWQKNGANIGGATSASYTTPATASADNGSTFQVVVSNSKGSTTSNAATLSVTSAAVAPTITTQPASQTVTVGQTATFSVAASGTAPLSYQWQKNGANISGATAASYTTPATTSADSGSTFKVLVSNAAGSATSNPATLTVTSDTTPPTVSMTSPSSGATLSGTVVLTATASDNFAVASVQFQVDGSNRGAPDTTSPYSFSLDTTTLSNGAHSLTAVAVDNSGNQATSIAVPITVSNQVSSGAVPTYANNGSGCPINTVAGGPTDSVASYNCPLPNPTGAGNLLVIFVRYINTNTPTVSFTDNVGGNTYTQAAACIDAANSDTQARIYYVQNVKAGVNRVTVNFSASTMRVQLGVYEFYNVATSAALDSANCQVSNGSSISSGALPSLTSGDLVMQFAHADNSVSIGSCAVGSQANITWTMRSALIASDEPMCAQYGIPSTTASLNPTMTFNRNVNYISLAAAFKAASAGTPPPSGIRVAYVQHDDGGSSLASSIAVELPVSGNLVAEVYTAGCGSNTLSSCNYATGFADGTNTWAQVGPTFMSSTASSQEAVGQIWYAKNALAGLYPINIPMNPETGISFSFPDSWIMYDIVGASSNPLDLGFGGAANGLASTSVNQSLTGSGGPFASFTATPSAANEVILATIGTEWDTYTGLTSPAGAQFLSANYIGETNYTWCDLNGGWGLFYNGASTAAETWTWTHDTSQGAGAGRGVALGVAFKPAP